MPDKKQFDRDSISNTLFVAIGLSLICSILVASAAVVLKPRQIRNQEEYRQRIILEVAGLMQPGADVAKLFTRVEPASVKIASGENIEIYLVRDNGKLQEILLPISGAGLWSTMYGYLAVAPDGNTVKGIRFYKHGETPGLGAQVDNEDWRAKWVGKQLYDKQGSPRIRVVRGFVKRDGSNPDIDYQVDGLSGATLTGNGVTKLVQHWIGPEGFGPYLETLR